ncbi:conserved hypothetical protein [Uncinocarpus reesii 1704]|uniref:Uncharacterized protein n=1 Tax=Uncinocarpus reesii (strain UAMH 1704) TaxID=336963 RepID=C4JFZ2_UNCRE|nr:uncharacterized protein UREG_01072 [Uncinocarpus reesii 1704]EEP76223.1 conserved hypothetical protein [Uncinocarpus reesii 1704]
MVAVSSSRGKPPKVRKGGTETTKAHRFEPFSQRIGKLKIDPIHRVRRNDVSDENGDDSFSHFRASLEHWTELNLSENFTEFSQRASRLCESLPQVLYHQDAIMDLLVEYIGRKDELSMEPLLSLMAQFARDLGSRFEKHFATAVQLVASVAATHPSVEVIEWSFTCLAWIFKFLSRLLVPDLRQLLEIMSPYLGKQPQKHFVARFAAESMSFLIRKAALVYYKNKAPLERAVAYLLDDLSKTEGTRQIEMYQDGLMNMFADAIKGVKGGIHSNGADILRCLICSAAVDDEARNAVAEAVLGGILINLVHHSTPDSFSPVLDTICEHIEASKVTVAHFKVNTRLIFLSVVTRKGSRVQNWKPILKALLCLLKQAAESSRYSPSAVDQLLGATAVAIQTSPMDELLPYMRQLMEITIHEPLSQHFLPFCVFLSNFGSDRFHSVVLPYFQRFILSLWQDYEAGLCLALPRLHGLDCVTSQSSRPGYVTCPSGWKDIVAGRFSIQDPTIDDIAFLNAYTVLQDTLSFSNPPPSIVPHILESLHHLVQSAANPSPSHPVDLDAFACGQGFFAYVQLAVQQKELDSNVWDLVSSRGAEFANVPVFLEATLEFMTASPQPPQFSEQKIEPFADALLSILSGPSHELRLSALKILQGIFRWLDIEHRCISIAIEIEDSELTLQTARELSMQVRRLASLYAETSKVKWLDRLIPNFCFGLLSKKLASLWDDSCQAIKVVCENANGERIVTELAVGWLQSGSAYGSDETGDAAPAEDRHIVTSEFQCFNVLNVEKSLLSSVEDTRNSGLRLVDEFKKMHKPVTPAPVHARSQALRVLTAVPQVAEKKSRQLVPLFLSWASRDDELPNAVDVESSATSTGDRTKARWDLRDKKATLALFGQFTNPKVLYKASEVHEALTVLLCNGDSEIQKLAIKAIFAWKMPAIQPYEQNLLNLIDDARFRDELAVFVQTGKDNNIIEDEHREGLFPYLLRLLYGKMVARAGLRGSQGGGQEGRRKAILRTISLLSEGELERFILIAFGALADINVLAQMSEHLDLLSQEVIGLRRQYGLLKMIETMYSTLKRRMHPYVERTMNVILYCVIRACRQLRVSDETSEEEANQDTQTSLFRNVRQMGIRCLDLVFSVAPDVNWAPYMPILFAEVIDPRLQNFAVETAQSISGLLRLFGTWSSYPKSALYLGRSEVVPHVVDILGVESARGEVKLFVLDQFLNELVKTATEPEKDKDGDTDIEAMNLVRSKILAPHIEHMLLLIDSLLRKQSSRQLTMSGVETLSKLAQFVESSAKTSKLINTTIYLLQQPPDRVPPKTKGGLLRVLQHFLPLYNPRDNGELSRQIFEVLSSMFDYFKDDPNRELLSTVFTLFSAHDSELTEVSRLAADLNSLSSKRLDEVDFDRRLGAFHTINEQMYSSFSARQWRPLLYNFLYHVKDDEELAIRSSSSLGLRRFIQCATAKEESEDIQFRELVDTVLLPSLKNGVKQKAETVRVEFVTVFGYFIQLHPSRPGVSDLHDLLAGGDEEASFFNNILHIQQHRRQRALRRLAAEVSKGKISASNISTIFFPLIEHYVFSQAEDENAHNLAAEAIFTIGALAGGLEWSQFRAIFRRFKSYLQGKSGMEKAVIRLLGQLTDALTRAAVPSPDMVQESADEAVKGRLSQSIPNSGQVASELKTHFIPFLSEFIHHKEESEVSLRLPVAVTTIKLLKLLPEDERALLLPPVLLDISNILKSKSQDSRDVARKTLADIALILGPSYFGYVLKELRTTLTKGYQLHVLSFTVHSILVTTSEEFKPGDLDQDLPVLASIVMDDIFGTVGQEKDAEGYVSKMKEVKASKSFDSMELLAKNASVGHVYQLVQPIQRLLEERLTSGIVKKVDDLLRRIAIGLLRNPGAESRDFLIFCYQVIKESYKTPDALQSDARAKPKDRFIIKMIAFNKSGTGRSTSSYLYKLARFGLDALRSVLNKYNSLLTAENLAGFLPIIGDALVQGYEEVKIAAIRLLSTIIKLPLEEIDRNSDVYLVEAMKQIKEAPSTDTEGAQAAIKLISSILRERQSIKLKDSHLAYLLKRVSSDIEEPDRQGITFNFIRAVMARKFLVPEMYELMDNIAVMMVTNHTRNARDLARGVYVHFLIDYPQTKNRWSKQLGYLAKNLDYRHKEGRQSVLEAVHLLLTKTNGELAQDIVGTFFVPIVMVMANDESPECREMAGILLNNIYSRAESDQLRSILSSIRTWLERTENISLVITGLQAMRIFFESDAADKENEAQFVITLLPRLMKISLDDQSSAEWETLYYSLQLFIKLSKLFPSLTLSPTCASIWSRIRQSLFFHHIWIKSCAANLIGTLFADVAKANAVNGYGSRPLTGSSGFGLDDNAMLEITRGCMFCLKTPTITEDLATQTIRNLVFLGRCFAQNNLELPNKNVKGFVDMEDDNIDSESDVDEAIGSPKQRKKAIQYVFEQAARILRRGPLTTRAESLTAKTACMKLIAALCNHLETAQISPSLQSVLLPLLHMTDPSIPAPRSMDEGFPDYL